MLSLITKFFLSLFLLISSNAYAISFEVIGPCSSTPVYSGKLKRVDLKNNVGINTVLIFDQLKIPYDGSAEGFRSILNTPTGEASIEILSESKMRAHGWCYTVNGFAPDVQPHEYFFTNLNDKLVWFFGYSTYDNGKWVDYCVPSYKVHSAQFCPK